MPTPDDIVTLAGLYLWDFPPGIYHQRDDDPGTLYRNGTGVFTIQPNDRHLTAALAATLALMLNHRKERLATTP